MNSAWQYVLGAEERRSVLGYDYLVKVLLIGDSGVGKSSMLLQFVEGPRGPQEAPEGSSQRGPPSPTIGVDYKSKLLLLDGKVTKIQVWDTAGHERFRSLTQAYFRSAMGILLVFDVSSKQSFLSLQYWLSVMREAAPPKVQVLLIGNKCDLREREVSREEALALAESWGVSYAETSSATGEGLQEAFLCLTRKVVQHIVAVERGLAGNCRRHSGVNTALKEGFLDTVQGISLMQQRRRHHSQKRQMQFMRYPIDDDIDSLCDV